ncbi:glycoside hydrolase family 43 protein [Duganella violaceipulchra]|uniref:Arabinan endo-1,5-alpha-L-arabinosidase n=1 Tax=Duganella violaceipulchra TaxID=2849652 RepID=A0AA41H918_9BURK|nr:glycoside hydrolase family 43 protein [Duganella violaceicalia]MBV6319821.1 glycoside hydrolase family 43 protein [Duganella violaceicalia]MCP2006362.1 arabinan endo-1,5-alpha-L-arabinosidase [Duganella violaceicalia]
MSEHDISISRRKAIAGGVALLLAGCGGGGGSSNPVTPVPTPTPAPTPAPTPVPTPTPTPSPTTITFGDASVHDPAVIKVDGTYYVFGSHLAAAKSTDLMNWTKIADGVNAANPLFNNVVTALADTFTWAQVTDLWAPDVVKLGDGKFYFYYNACKGDSPRSALGVAVADKIEGPYVNKQIMLKSGMWGQISEDGVNVYDALTMPNVVDPNTFFDKDGKLWMIYGSYSGGIFILAMDPATGLQKPGQGYGKHLMGGNHSRIEGAYVMYSPQSKFYYLFTSFGGLDANGAYNMRVARSLNPDGPYVDAKGNDMANVKANPSLPLFDDASIAPFGQKIMGNHQFALADGETGTPLGYVSPGHNSAYYEASTGQYFLVFHTRFPGTGELHQIRVHEMFINEDGWIVVSPFRYAPLSKNSTALSAEVTVADAAGAYKMINHGKDITAAIKPSQNIKLAADGTVSGAATGTWKHNGANKITITLGATGTFNGVLSRQWNTNASAFVVTWTAQSVDGVSIWGARTGS